MPQMLKPDYVREGYRGSDHPIPRAVREYIKDNEGKVMWDKYLEICSENHINPARWERGNEGQKVMWLTSKLKQRYDKGGKIFIGGVALDDRSGV